MKTFGFDSEMCWDYENGFYLTSHPNRIGKLVAHYELYKKIVHLPGEILEFGVFKGASFIRLLTFRELLESTYSRKIIGFDAFGEFPLSGNKDDNKYAKHFENYAGKGISQSELETIIDFKSFNNYELMQGNIIETLPKYFEKNPQIKISYLHIDTDVYEPAKIILEHCFDRVVKNGLIVLDDYPTVLGEVNAVDEFFKDKDYVINKLSISHIPSFIVKK